MKGTVLLVRTMIQMARGILDMTEMVLKPKACNLAGSLPLPHHHCRKRSVHLCFQFPPIEQYFIDRLTIGCTG
jgi:hypothetical protein